MDPTPTPLPTPMWMTDIQLADTVQFHMERSITYGQMAVISAIMLLLVIVIIVALLIVVKEWLQ
ncbi:hypothetical protein BECAL_02287 [Bellilinea caldifistulae]|uniref:Uncharacterized protein n=1 Tax=Bellilinea caldifistulae TaxID=360411 RepID=A0A0P6WUA1_9CHLR|nr:hypothetical protein [Bellilinea caldifistulae]KPL73828.1 hypothetical protein AC812_13645 [Bellilinea caldifistulae]GAP11102.1 hypothetical protein BECAL_02287 [Bellilinea caldifistulae]